MLYDTIDIRTITFLTTFVAVMNAAFGVLLWRSHPAEKSLPIWALGSTFVAVGYLEVALRGWIPLVLSIPVAHACITAGHTLYLNGIFYLRGQKAVPLSAIAALVAVVFASSSYYTFVDDDIAMRMSIWFSVIALLALATARSLLFAKGQVGTLTHRVAGWIFVAFGLALMVRLALIPFALPDQDLFAPSAINDAVFVTVLLFHAALMYCFPALLYAKELASREASEAALRDSDSDYRAILDTTLDGFWLLDAHGRLLDVNNRYADQSGYSRDELLSMEICNLEAIENAEETRRHIQFVIANGHDQFETEHRRKDGSTWHVEISAVFAPLGRGKFFAFLRDISPRKRAEAAIHSTQIQLEATLKAIPDLLFEVDDEGRYHDVYTTNRDLLLLPAETLAGKTINETLPAEAAAIGMAALREAAMQGQSHGKQMLLTLPHGECWFELSVARKSTANVTGQRFIVLSRDITARKRVELELSEHRQHLEDLVTARTEQMNQAKDAAEAANRAKSIFLSNMSHELRTPLNSILGFGQLLEMDPELNQQQREEVRTINESGYHLLGIINDVLEIARIESGRLSVSTQDFDLHALLRMVGDSMKLLAHGKGLEFRIEKTEGLPHWVNTDLRKMRQVLLNLLSNAVKYTQQGEVVLSASVATGDGRTLLKFEISDTGVGIEAADLTKLFDPFFQTAHGVLQGQGTGLGLAICRQYAELLGGTLDAESEPGSGSLFRFAVPVSVVAAAEANAAPPPQNHAMCRQRILVVEDDPPSRTLMMRLLTRAGYLVETAENGRSATEMFAVWHPDLIWMDMRMLGMDGYEATRRIRSLPEGRRIPIIALTAFAFAEDRGRIIAAGCNDVLTKPLDADAMLSLTARYLAESPNAWAPAT